MRETFIRFFLSHKLFIFTELPTEVWFTYRLFVCLLFSSSLWSQSWQSEAWWGCAVSRLTSTQAGTDIIARLHSATKLLGKVQYRGSETGSFQYRYGLWTGLVWSNANTTQMVAGERVPDWTRKDLNTKFPELKDLCLWRFQRNIRQEAGSQTAWEK